MPNIAQVIVAALVISVVLMLGTTVVSNLTESESGLRVDDSTAVMLGDTGEYVKIEDGEGFDETVVNSRGYAVNMTGADDSYVESSSDFDLATDDTWTISLWAHVDDDSAGETMTAMSANGRVVVNYNGSDGNWTVWYYNEGDRSSWQANVSAPNQPGNLTNVMVWSNGTHLTIYRNDTKGETVEITGENIESVPVTTSNWDGRIDEVRTFDDALNSSRRSQVVNSPIAPQPDTNRTSRIMFDQPEKSTQLVFFADTELVQSNVTFSAGLPGEELERKNTMNDLEGTTDYAWKISGPQIKPVEGGQLDGAPVAYVDYEFEGALSSVVDGWSDLVSMAAVIPLLIIVGLIIRVVQGA